MLHSISKDVQSDYFWKKLSQLTLEGMQLEALPVKEGVQGVIDIADIVFNAAEHIWSQTRLSPAQ